MRPIYAALLAASLLLTACGGADSTGTGGSEAVATADDTATDAADSEPAATPSGNPKDDADLTLPSEVEASPPPAPPTDEPPTEAPPPEPTGPPTEDLPGGRYVQIDSITAEGQSYAINFTPYNFDPLIGSGPQDFHIHFFWDTVEPQNAGTNGPNPGSWELYDGASPFTAFSFAARPPEATQLCALVADAAHGVTVGSGNCATLP